MLLLQGIVQCPKYDLIFRYANPAVISPTPVVCFACLSLYGANKPVGHSSQAMCPSISVLSSEFVISQQEHGHLAAFGTLTTLLFPNLDPYTAQASTAGTAGQTTRTASRATSTAGQTTSTASQTTSTASQTTSTASRAAS